MQEPNDKMEDVHSDFYRNLRSRITNFMQTQSGSAYPFTDALLAAPDLFYLITRLLADPTVDVKSKAKLALTVAYFLSPLDFVPELVLGPIGFLDDAALAALALDSIINLTPKETLDRYWPGKENVLTTIQGVLGNAHQMLGAGVWSRLKKMFRR